MWLVAMIADGIGVANKIQPVDRHALAEVLGIEKLVYQFIIGCRRWILDKLVDSF